MFCDRKRPRNRIKEVHYTCCLSGQENLRECGRKFSGRRIRREKGEKREKKGGSTQVNGESRSSIGQLYEKRTRFYKVPLPSNDNHRAVTRRPTIQRLRFSFSYSFRAIVIKWPFGSSQFADIVGFPRLLL